MKRREILKSTALLTGYALSAGTIAAVMNGCKADTAVGWTPTFFESNQMELLSAIADRIIPKTETPGAIDALVHRYIDEALKNNYTIEDQGKFKEGLLLFDTYANEKYNKSFVALEEQDKDAVLQRLADESKKNPDEDHIFSELRTLTVSGFLTSEIGATEFLEFDPIPGQWSGCYDYSQVEKAWSLY